MTKSNNCLQSIPIPITEYGCSRSKACCTRRFLPLVLAYGRTIHKFQGQSAGPVDKGKIENMYSCIVCDPDEKRFEGSSLGLLYTAVSRGTTLGDKDGTNSAVYFDGKDFKEDRIRQLYKCKDSDKDYALAEKHDDWVALLKQNTRDFDLAFGDGTSKLKDILHWASNNTVGDNELCNRVTTYTTTVANKRTYGRRNKRKR